MLHWMNGPKKKNNNSDVDSSTSDKTTHPKKQVILDIASQNGLSASVIQLLNTQLQNEYFEQTFDIENAINILIKIATSLGSNLDFDTPEELFFTEIAAKNRVPEEKIKVIFATLIKSFKSDTSLQDLILQIEEILSSK